MRKTIGFVTGGLGFNGNTLNEKALGGSESAMIYMARELAALGNTVYVYCLGGDSKVYDGVVYLPLMSFLEGQNLKLDVLVISRLTRITPKVDVSNMTIFWMHDIYDEEYAEAAYLMDKTFLMSEYQKSLWLAGSKHYDPAIWVTKNGFDSDLAKNIPMVPFEEKRNHYIFASRPERGLKFLLTYLWPNILAMNPNAQLHLTKYDNPIIMPEDTQELYREVDELIKTSKNIVQHGSLIKKEYYELLAKCAYMVYPTNFPEISCINAIEAQAMGCMVITTDDFALSETVKTDTLISSVYGARNYIDEFLDVVEKFQHHGPYMSETTLARAEILASYSWKAIARDWNNHIDQFFEDRYYKYRSQIHQRLFYNSDYYTLSKIDPEFDATIVDSVVQSNKNTSYYSPYGADIFKMSDIPISPRQEVMIQTIGEYAQKRSNLTVLEVGCWDGIMSGMLYKSIPTYIDKVIAYDACAGALAAYKEIWEKNPQCKNIQYINDDVLNVKSHKIQADVVIVGEILEHVVDYKKLLEDLRASTKPDGLIMFSTPVGPWSWITLREQGRDAREDHHLHHFELNDIQTIFSDYHKKGQFVLYNIEGMRNHRDIPCDNYIFGIINSDPSFQFYEFDPFEKAKKTRPYFTLSVCMITKNEEDHLSKCLKSVKGIADEIIIVDTGSTDDTKRIAAKFTDKVYDHKWEESDGLGNFGAARNVSVEKATGDWILYIDADEVLTNPRAVCKYLNSLYVKDYLILQKQIVDAGINVDDQTPPRLFRNDGTFKFYDAIHELPRQDPYRGNDTLEMRMSDTKLLHFGYLSPGVGYLEKVNRNQALLKKNMTLWPNKIEDFNYYMRTMLYYYEVSKDTKFLDAALKRWSEYPFDKRSNKFETRIWDTVFELAQKCRNILKDNYNASYFVGPINHREYLFADKKEFKKIKKILEVK